MGLLGKTINDIMPQDASWRERATERVEQLTMPRWALGRLLDLAVDLAGMTRSLRPGHARRLIVTLAADHGVARRGVSQYPQAVTAQMVANFAAGGAAVNALSRVANCGLLVVDMGVAGDLSALVERGVVVDASLGAGTADIAAGPAMTRQQAVRCVEQGIRIVSDRARQVDLFGTGEMGIGNTTSAAAICSCLTGEPPARVTGRGTGVDDAGLRRKIRAVEVALERNRPDPEDGLDALSKVGGFEIGGIAGVILGAALHRRPVLVDGFISTAGALIAHALCPATVEYTILAHSSAEPGHEVMCAHLGKSPLLDLDLRLGEGTGAALAMPLVEGAARVLSEVATFTEAGVAGVDA